MLASSCKGVLWSGHQCKVAASNSWSLLLCPDPKGRGGLHVQPGVSLSWLNHCHFVPRPCTYLEASSGNNGWLRKRLAPRHPSNLLPMTLFGNSFSWGGRLWWQRTYRGFRIADKSQQFNRLLKTDLVLYNRSHEEFCQRNDLLLCLNWISKLFWTRGWMGGWSTAHQN